MCPPTGKSLKERFKSGYIVEHVHREETYITADLTVTGQTRLSHLGHDVAELALKVTFETPSRLHIVIGDRQNRRWRVPESIFERPSPDRDLKVDDLAYSVDVLTDKPGENGLIPDTILSVTRNEDGAPVFRASLSQMVFKDQYIELVNTGIAPKNANIYGLGENVSALRKDPDGSIWTIFARDAPSPPNENLYGCHPVYMELRDGKAHGVFLLNSNGMDIELHPGTLIYKIIGGILEFYVLLGPTPLDVCRQYTDVVGLPAPIPYWSLGFHQCRWGYYTLDEVKKVVRNFKKAKIPLDCMWFDIDYMEEFKDFTYDPIRYPAAELQAFIDKLHERNQHAIMIVDPGVKVETNYPSFEQGLQLDIYMKNRKRANFMGKVWPGRVHFPDFFHPKAYEYWDRCLREWYEISHLDGVWLDMNELANFCKGECKDDPRTPNKALHHHTHHCTLEYPPYRINNAGEREDLHTNTTSMDSVHYGDVLEYDVHNLYGHMESIATYKALTVIEGGKRPFVLCRSTFAGSGRWTTHWLGDNFSTFESLAYSIPGCINFQLFGIHMVGPDIGGFNGEPSEELLTRWMQMSAFYPFSRNHNVRGAKPQEPFVTPQVTHASRIALHTRYKLLPYWYTLFHEGWTRGTPVLRPLCWEFPMDPKTWDMDTQFMIGPSILVAPILRQGQERIVPYLPKSNWYNLYHYKEIPSAMPFMSAPLTEPTPAFIRGGYVVPTHHTPSLTVHDSRESGYDLLVALDDSQNAGGTLYIDDGISLKTTPTKSSYEISFTATASSVRSSGAKVAEDVEWAIPDSYIVHEIVVMGVRTEDENTDKPFRVTVNGDARQSTLDIGVLKMDVGVHVSEAFEVVWGWGD
ncbi:uncharacterized protein SPPG_01807 [Spizellomyces punctatus DAOM BR117]|uniref:alpha-glucosidase n=1 Tax=Spizellomyces punctatus (strain DAOM BR117) TaxID=645134 RepID=A0A0L0HPJ8_SPIPD|nr:uncharacterized protein SPPG_01807 [Spizellomyces punctatus DAOM BR117]KND02724.1 hypothetical protein SPPG_01807 [Spizellomyces punctatus DAOM BR117]|eukprot:XP_016610763.1 hypothetical protein SPPG_01807 [Spizellomyces punctatus DAOM BR117]